jgi:hypothetical protein
MDASTSMRLLGFVVSKGKLQFFIAHSILAHYQDLLCVMDHEETGSVPVTGRVVVGVRIRPPFDVELTSTSTSASASGATGIGRSGGSGGRCDPVVRVIRPPHRASHASSPPHSIAKKVMLSKAVPSSEAREFEFDKAFGPESTQEDIYKTIAEPLVDAFLAGYNGTLFAYGQTGTGKTFTMGILDRVSMKTGGLVPSSLRHIFGSLHESPKRNFTVTMNFLQIYMENIQDLLNPSSGRPVLLREKPGQGLYAEGHEEVEVFCIEDAVELINNGLENRVMAPTLMNATSSRSHTAITVTLKREVSPAKTIVSRFRLVDLAGSERVRKTKSSGARLEEAKV